jgi:hypothetical protein
VDLARPRQEGGACVLSHPLVGDDQGDRLARVAKRPKEFEGGRRGAFRDHAVIATVTAGQTPLKPLARLGVVIDNHDGRTGINCHSAHRALSSVCASSQRCGALVDARSIRPRRAVVTRSWRA